VLTDKPTPAQIEAAVHQAIADVLERAGRQPGAIDNDSPLLAVGLTSLDLAAVIAVLQSRLKVDPFFVRKAITDMRTVGDLCRAYRDMIGEG
jgi:acyl carrier protein